MELKTTPAFQMLTKAGTGERERRLKAAIKWWLVIKCRQNRIHTSAIHTKNTQKREIMRIQCTQEKHNFNMYKPHTNTIQTYLYGIYTRRFQELLRVTSLDNGIPGRQFMSTIEMHYFDH